MHITEKIGFKHTLSGLYINKVYKATIGTEYNTKLLVQCTWPYLSLLQV